MGYIVYGNPIGWDATPNYGATEYMILTCRCISEWFSEKTADIIGKTPYNTLKSSSYSICYAFIYFFIGFFERIFEKRNKLNHLKSNLIQLDTRMLNQIFQKF